MKFLPTVLLFTGAVALLTLSSTWSHRKSLESALGERSNQLLQKEGFGHLSVEFNHLNARVTGYVASEGDKTRALNMLADHIPVAYFPSVDRANIKVRPSLPCWLKVSRKRNSGSVLLEGMLGPDGDKNRKRLELSLFQLGGVDEVQDEIELDDRRFAMKQPEKLTNLAVTLISRSDFGELKIDEHGLAISGEVEDDSTRGNLLLLAAEISDRILAKCLVVRDAPALPNRTEFRLVRSRFGISISGVVPNFATKNQLFQEVSRNTKDKVGIRMEIDSESGDCFWLENAVTLLPLLLAQTRGELELSYAPHQTTIRGTLESAGTRNQILKSLSDFTYKHASMHLDSGLFLPREIVLDSNAKQAQLMIDIRPDRVELSGQVQSTDLAKSVHQSALQRARDFDATVSDAIKSRQDLPSDDLLRGFPGLLKEAFQRIRTGKVIVRGDEVLLLGETQHAGDREALQQSAENSFRKGYGIVNFLKTSHQAPLPDRSSINFELAKSLQLLPIYFQSGSAELSEKESRKISQIAEAIQSSKSNASFVLGAFTDSAGNPEYNRKLGLRRANAFREQLLESGIQAGLLRIENLTNDQARSSGDDQLKDRRVEVRIDSKNDM